MDDYNNLLMCKVNKDFLIVACLFVPFYHMVKNLFGLKVELSPNIWQGRKGMWLIDTLLIFMKRFQETNIKNIWNLI